MGGVGDFLFGGSSQQQQGQNSSNQSSSSQNQSTSNSNQASSSASQNQAANGNYQYNQAYAPVASAMTPALGYTAAAGNMLASLLGVPIGSSPSVPHYTPPSSPLPKIPTTATPSTTPLGNLIKSLAGSSTSSAAPPISTTGPTTSTPAGTQTPVAGTGAGGSISNRDYSLLSRTYLKPYAFGGNVAAGQPIVVGERQPELFVPHTSGTVIPSVPTSGFGRLTGGPLPGTAAPNTAASTAPATAASTATTPMDASSALNNFANSAGENFVLDQGQKALSGASAANGTFDSGATGKALVQYGQNLGNTYLNQYMQNLSNLAGIGTSAANAMTGPGGVGVGQGYSSGSSLSNSAGTSASQSTGSSNASGSSQGTTSGSGSSKKGLVPDILGG